MTDSDASIQERTMLEDIASFLPEFPRARGSLVPILQMIQQRHAYLSAGAIAMVAEHLGISMSEVYGVATFYNQFRFHPPGKRRIKVCMGTACHVVGGDIILEHFERKLDIKNGETTPDREFSLESVACVGCCALAPVALVNEETHGHMVPSRVEGLMLGFDMEKEEKARQEQKNASRE